MRRSIILALAALSAAVALVVASVVQAAPAAGKLSGTVGPGFTISVSKKSVKAGKYTITVNDKSNIHNWHISGPGVNKATSVSGTGTTKFTVTLKKGKTYKIVCDPHASTMVTRIKAT
jgi:plastocyanin